jgi:hypothetical protein
MMLFWPDSISDISLLLDNDGFIKIFDTFRCLCEIEEFIGWVSLVERLERANRLLFLVCTCLFAKTPLLGECYDRSVSMLAREHWS